MFTWNSIVAVGLGGFVGAVARFMVSVWTQNLWRVAWFPVGTITVNLVGCFILGALAGWNEEINMFPAVARAFFLIGLLGSFTTFSTFSYDNVILLNDGRYLAAAVNGLGQLVLGGGFVFLGHSLIVRLGS